MLQLKIPHAPNKTWYSQINKYFKKLDLKSTGWSNCRHRLGTPAICILVLITTNSRDHKTRVTTEKSNSDQNQQKAGSESRSSFRWRSLEVNPGTTVMFAEWTALSQERRRHCPGGQTPIQNLFRSVAQWCPTLCRPIDCSMPGLPVHHQLPELAQTHVHLVGDAIQPSRLLSPPSPPALNLSQHQGFCNESVLCIRWPKYWSFSFNISPSNEYPGLISFRIDWFDLLAVQGILESHLQIKRHETNKPVRRGESLQVAETFAEIVKTGRSSQQNRRLLCIFLPQEGGTPRIQLEGDQTKLKFWEKLNGART